MIDSFGVLFEKKEEGSSFYLVESASEKVLAVEGNNTANGTPIVVAERDGSAGQKWTFVHVTK